MGNYFTETQRWNQICNFQLADVCYSAGIDPRTAPFMSTPSSDGGMDTFSPTSGQRTERPRRSGNFVAAQFQKKQLNDKEIYPAERLNIPGFIDYSDSANPKLMLDDGQANEFAEIIATAKMNIINNPSIPENIRVNMQKILEGDKGKAVYLNANILMKVMDATVNESDKPEDFNPEALAATMIEYLDGSCGDEKTLPKVYLTFALGILDEYSKRHPEMLDLNGQTFTEKYIKNASEGIETSSVNGKSTGNILNSWRNHLGMDPLNNVLLGVLQKPSNHIPAHITQHFTDNDPSEFAMKKAKELVKKLQETGDKKAIVEELGKIDNNADFTYVHLYLGLSYKHDPVLTGEMERTKDASTAFKKRYYSSMNSQISGSKKINEAYWKDVIRKGAKNYENILKTINSNDAQINLKDLKNAPQAADIETAISSVKIAFATSPQAAYQAAEAAATTQDAGGKKKTDYEYVSYLIQQAFSGYNQDAAGKLEVQQNRVNFNGTDGGLRVQFAALTKLPAAAQKEAVEKWLKINPGFEPADLENIDKDCAEFNLFGGNRTYSEFKASEGLSSLMPARATSSRRADILLNYKSEPTKPVTPSQLPEGPNKEEPKKVETPATTTAPAPATPVATSGTAATPTTGAATGSKEVSGSSVDSSKKETETPKDVYDPVLVDKLNKSLLNSVNIGISSQTYASRANVLKACIDAVNKETELVEQYDNSSTLQGILDELKTYQVANAIVLTIGYGSDSSAAGRLLGQIIKKNPDLNETQLLYVLDKMNQFSSDASAMQEYMSKIPEDKLRKDANSYIPSTSAFRVGNNLKATKLPAPLLDYFGWGNGCVDYDLYQAPILKKLASK